jgi:hypothetical protein
MSEKAPSWYAVERIATQHGCHGKPMLVFKITPSSKYPAV